MISNLIGLEGEQKNCLCQKLYQTDFMKGNGVLVIID